MVRFLRPVNRTNAWRAALTTGALAGALLIGVGPAAAEPCVVGAAGDVAGTDYRTGAQRSGDLIRRENPVAVIAPGDLAYESGSATEFATYYNPTWGSFEEKTLAVPGNHEARTSGFAGIRAQFDDTVDDNRAVTVCGWRVILVNQYRGISTAADFIRAEGGRHPTLPKIVVWHEPRYSSGAHSNATATQPLWEAVRTADVRARIVVNGHDHNYERFAPMLSKGTRSDATGTREFVSGLGGHGIRPLGTTKANSQKRYTGSPAVLFLTLNSDASYSWELKRHDGAVLDSGSQPVPPS